VILLRSSPYGSGVLTYLDEDAGVVQKSTYNKSAMESLRREHQGYHWYLNRIGQADRQKLNWHETVDSQYIRIRIPFISGSTPNYNHSVETNSKVLKLVIDHYFEVWPQAKSGLSHLHGDFSVGNTILQGPKVFVIDWEHFRPESAPYGLDLANLLYESLFFSIQGKTDLSQSDRRCFLELRKKIVGQLPKSDFDFSLDGLQKFILGHTEWWGDLVRKLPVLKFTPEQAKAIAAIEASHG
jgi:hypothetical protein